MGYTHVEIARSQSPKKSGAPCGDVLAHERTAFATTVVCCDGIGSGIKANIAATMCVSRLMELLRGGFSLRQAFNKVVRTMRKWRSPEMPYAVLSVARIRNDGEATILSYDIPPPLLVGRRHATLLPHRTETLATALVAESNCHIEPGEGILLVSDGITQAGLGAGLSEGWTIEGVRRYVDDCLADGVELKRIPRFVHDQARQLWKTGGDDCTAVLAACRPGVTLNVLTGPPSSPARDGAVVEEFMRAEGWKVVCGASTAKIVAKHTHCELAVEQNAESMLAPPRYLLPGIDLVTEGAVTLNQVVNLLGEDPKRFEDANVVTELCELLQTADRVNFTVGVAANPASTHITFQQQGILTRAKVIPHIVDKLREQGKLVVVNYV
ncbi:MAG: SpoIIE family protein phosphatase [Phycisphaerae bacterium]|nr:SpoIIE family protein phosphatase [Phycisphaerae bacterium]